MTPRQLTEFILLAAIWGASFLFMRIAAPTFGPAPLMLVRCAVGALVLLPFVLLRPAAAVAVGGAPSPPSLRSRVLPVFAAGFFNSAVPFVLLGFASLSLSVGFLSILNATTPIFGTLVAFLWLRERLTAWRVAGLVVGLLGVAALSADKATFHAGGSGWAILAVLIASLSYGLAGHLARRSLAGVDPLKIAVGSQSAAALVLLAPGWWYWPAASPPAAAWLGALALGAISSGVAYLLFYRLIAQVGSTATLSVTFLIPVFGILWGGVFLGETVDAVMLVGASIVLLGTAMAAGVLGGRRGAPASR